MLTPMTGNQTKFRYSMTYSNIFTEADEAEIIKILTEDASLAGLAIAE